MRLFLLQLIVLFSIIINGNAQYTITGTVNSSSYSCVTFSGNTIIYIGNGVTTTNLSMNQTLDLYNSCSLGPVQFIVRNNASVDFSPGNSRLILPVGSSIIIEQGGALIGGSCNASERIYIGTDLIASCNGQAGADFSFNQLVINGGYNYVKTTVSPICGSGTAAIAVSVIPTPSAATTYRLYTVASGGSPVSSVISSTSPYAATLTTPTITSNTTYYISATTGSVTTPRRSVSVTVTPIPSTTSTNPSPVVCMNTLMTNITHTTTGATGIGTPTGLPDGVTASWALNTITISGAPTVSGTFNYSIPLTGGCGVVNATGTITVNALPNNVINGFSATTICVGGSPQLTFDAENATFSIPYSITYKNDNTSIQYTVSIPTASPYSFTPADNPTTNAVYTLVSVSNATCTRTSGFSHSGANLRVRPIPTATISSTTSVCVGDSSPDVTFTNPQSVAVIVTYTINGGADQLINIAANGTAVVTVPTTTANTYHYDLVSVVYQSTPNCSNTISGRATVVVNPNLFASVAIAASPSVAICSGTSVTFTATPINGGTAPIYQWKLNGVNVGSNSSTYTNASLVNSDVLVCVMVSNATPCLTASPATSNEITMIVNPVPAEPVVGSITQPTCKEPTASVELSGLPATGTWTINPGGYTGTGITTTISGLAVTTYNFTVSTGNCTSAPSAAVIITPVVITAYNGTTWSSTPDSTKAGVVSGSGIISVDTDLCSCTVDANVIASVASGITLRLQDKLTVNGTLTFENNASLVQVNDDAVNTGNIIYKRNTTPVNRYDYTYWSSPVAGFTLKKLSPFTLFDRYFSYDDGWKVSLSGVDVMKAGHGYIVRAPQTYPISGSPSPYPARFEGVPNNGIFNLMLIANKDYLLGNPYPSAISADQFLEDNQAALQGTLYFWTHNSPPVAASGTTTYKYTASDYASYNRTGGTKAAASGGDEPLGKIAAGQGFFAPASTIGGLVVFNNDMRIRGGIAGIDNAQFFKLIENSKLKTPTSLTEKSRIWLNLTNNEGAFKQTLIGYIKGATNEYDNGFDGVTYNGNQYLDFYSINQDKNLAIQGRALPFVPKDSIALGYKSTIKGDFQISIDRTDGILSSQQVFLEDKSMKLLHDLKNSPYVFSTEIGVFNDRFALHYEDKSIVGKIREEEPLAVNDQVIVSVRNNEITVSSFSDLITNITIYDVSGQRVYQKEEIAVNSFTIQNLNLANQVLLVQLTLESGETVSTKIVY